MSEEEEESGGGGEEEGTPAWMATFADMMSLLLTFFVLILSFANMDVIKFSAAVDSLRDAFGTAIALQEFEGSPTLTPIDLSATGMPQVVSFGQCDDDKESARLRGQIESVIKRLSLEKMVEVEDSDGGVTVRIVGQLLFDPGSVTLRPESFVLLNEISELIQAVPEHVSIEGHTDETPLANQGGMSNWHLSTGRAISVLDYLTDIQNVDPRRLAVSGHSSMRPLFPNDTAEHRERNRRVEFVFRRATDTQRTASR